VLEAVEQRVRLREGVFVLATEADAIVWEGEVVRVGKAVVGMGETVPEMLVVCEPV